MAVSGLSCSRWDLVPRDQTQALCIESVESWPLDQQGNPRNLHFQRTLPDDSIARPWRNSGWHFCRAISGSGVCDMYMEGKGRG